MFFMYFLCDVMVSFILFFVYLINSKNRTSAMTFLILLVSSSMSNLWLVFRILHVFCSELHTYIAFNVNSWNRSSLCHLFSCASHLKFIQEVLQGAAVTLAELGDYIRAASFLQDLAKVRALLFIELGYSSIKINLLHSAGETKWPWCFPFARGSKIWTQGLWRECCCI